MFGKTLTLGLAAAALAVTPAAHAQSGQWTPYHSEDLSYAAGDVCPFELVVHIVSDMERYRTTAYFPDGSPRYQEFTGQLVIEYTNTETGESVVHNLTGRGDSSASPTAGSRSTTRAATSVLGCIRATTQGRATTSSPAMVGRSMGTPMATTRSSRATERLRTSASPSADGSGFRPIREGCLPTGRLATSQ